MRAALHDKWDRQNAERRKDAPPVAGEPPVKLAGDADLVRLCRNAGGFPRVEMVQGRAAWVWPHRSEPVAARPAPRPAPPPPPAPAKPAPKKPRPPAPRNVITAGQGLILDRLLAAAGTFVPAADLLPDSTAADPILSAQVQICRMRQAMKAMNAPGMIITRQGEGYAVDPLTYRALAAWWAERKASA